MSRGKDQIRAYIRAKKTAIYFQETRMNQEKRDSRTHLTRTQQEARAGVISEEERETRRAEQSHECL